MTEVYGASCNIKQKNKDLGTLSVLTNSLTPPNFVITESGVDSGLIRGQSVLNPSHMISS